MDLERWVSRSFATHALLCNTQSSNKLCPKTVKTLAVKGLIKSKSFFGLKNIFVYTQKARIRKNIEPLSHNNKHVFGNDLRQS